MNVNMFNRLARAVRPTLISANFAMLLAILPLTASATDSGRQLYLAHCSGCHGANGISVMPQAQNFSRAKLLVQPDQDLIEIIRSGRNLMPAYFGILSEQEITLIINYLRKLD